MLRATHPTTQYHNPEDLNLQPHCYENLRSYDQWCSWHTQQQGHTNFPRMCKPYANSKCQKGKMKLFQDWWDTILKWPVKLTIMSFLIAAHEIIVHFDVRKKTTMITPKIRYQHTKFNHLGCVHPCQKVWSSLGTHLAIMCSSHHARVMSTPC